MDHINYCKQFLKAGGRILDIGAGRGKFLAGMAELGFEVYGVETNPEYIGGYVLGTRAEELPFEDASFDFVNCAEVSEHVDDPIKMLKEIFRVLKPGGRCYISFHNRWGVYDYRASKKKTAVRGGRNLKLCTISRSAKLKTCLSLLDLSIKTSE